MRTHACFSDTYVHAATIRQWSLSASHGPRQRSGSRPLQRQRVIRLGVQFHNRYLLWPPTEAIGSVANGAKAMKKDFILQHISPSAARAVQQYIVDKIYGYNILYWFVWQYQYIVLYWLTIPCSVLKSKASVLSSMGCLQPRTLEAVWKPCFFWIKTSHRGIWLWSLW